jgi:hypothetical protein
LIVTYRFTAAEIYDIIRLIKPAVLWPSLPTENSHGHSSTPKDRILNGKRADAEIPFEKRKK